MMAPEPDDPLPGAAITPRAARADATDVLEAGSADEMAAESRIGAGPEPPMATVTGGVEPAARGGSVIVTCGAAGGTADPDAVDPVAASVATGVGVEPVEPDTETSAALAERDGLIGGVVVEELPLVPESALTAPGGTAVAAGAASGAAAALGLDAGAVSTPVSKATRQGSSLRLATAAGAGGGAAAAWAATGAAE
jgi:hypothetical protein